MLTLTLIKEVGAPAVSEKAVKKIAAALNREIKTKQKLHVNLVLVSDNAIRKINRIYRKQNKVTDVLSFRYDEQNGEIFIAYPRAQKQAKDNKISVLKEVSGLAIHGLLHVAGYKHKTAKDYKKMMSKQEKILNLCSH